MRVYLACVAGNNIIAVPLPAASLSCSGRGGKKLSCQISIKTCINPTQPGQVKQLPVFHISNSYFSQVKSYEHSVLPPIYYTSKYVLITLSTQFFMPFLFIKIRIYRENLRCSSNPPDVFQSFEKVEEFEKGSEN